jgi:hypothetical protein
MAWATPKTNWTSDNVIWATDLNRIESNILYLYGLAGTTLLSGFGADIAAPGTPYGVEVTNQFHFLTGSGTIKFIKNYTGLAAGHKVYFVKKDAGSVFFDDGTTLSGYSPLVIAGAAVLGLDLDEVVSFIYDGTSWYTEQKN